jgi:hypothetical protein
MNVASPHFGFFARLQAKGTLEAKQKDGMGAIEAPRLPLVEEQVHVFLLCCAPSSRLPVMDSDCLRSARPIS